MIDIDVIRGMFMTFVGLTVALTSACRCPAALASASPSSTASCSGTYDASASYPALPDPDGPDVSGEPGVLMYLHADHGVAELDGCFHELDRPLVIDVTGLGAVTLLFELPDDPEGAWVNVTEDGVWIETLELSDSTFSYVMDPEHELGFEITTGGSPAPTGPTIRTRPSGNPPPP